MLQTVYNNSDFSSRSVNFPDLITSNTRRVLLFAGCMLCIVSLILTVKLTLTMADNRFDQVLMATLGVGIELCKWIFVPLGLILLFRLRGVTALPLLAAGCAVTVVSILASMGFLVTQGEVTTRNAVRSSAEYQTLLSQLNSKKLQIEALQGQANIDSQSRYSFVRGRTNKSVEAMRSLEQEQRSILAQMQKVSGDTKSSTATLFHGLSQLLHQPAEQIKLIAYIVLSILLEICGMIALALATLSKIDHDGKMSSRMGTLAQLKDKDFVSRLELSKKEKDKGRAKVGTGKMFENNRLGRDRARVEQRKKRAQAQADGVPDTGTNNGKDTRYQKARTLIQQGRVRPTFRTLKSVLNMGNETARRYLAKMEEEGIIYKKGQSYAVA